MGVWVNTDLTGDKPQIKEVFKMPILLTTKLPTKFQGKEYMVMDLENMTTVPGMPKQDYKKIIDFSKEFQPKILDFIAKYSKQFNPSINMVNKVGTKDIVQSGAIYISLICIFFKLINKFENVIITIIEN